MEKILGMNYFNKQIYDLIQKTKNALPGYFNSCLKQRLSNGLGSTTDYTSVEDLEKALMNANWSPWIDSTGVLTPGCSAVITTDIHGHHGMLNLSDFSPDDACHFRDPKNTGFLSLCIKTDKRQDVDFTILIIGPEEGIGDVMYTFHPGNPVQASTFKSGETNEKTGKTYKDGDEITVAEAMNLGFKHVKAE